jgi:hypothetical protein
VISIDLSGRRDKGGLPSINETDCTNPSSQTKEYNPSASLKLVMGVLGRSPIAFFREGESTMGTMSKIVKQLRKERDRVEKQLSGLNAAISAFTAVYTGSSKATRKRSKMSAAVRARIAAAQRKRWAKLKKKRK